MTTLTERITALSPEQRKLLQERLQASQTKHASEENIPCLTKRGAYPLSFAQQRLWFLDAYHQGSPFYNFSLEYKILGVLNSEALLASLMEIVRRHEAWRTDFIIDGEQPVQIVHSGDEWRPELMDLRSIPQDARESEANRLLRNAAKHTFDLAHGPLLRVLLLQLSATEHILQIVIHHIVFDGWSIKILVHELESLYAAFCINQPSPLLDLSIQYRDFSVWQREQLQGERLKKLLAFWREALTGLIPFDMPADHPRPQQQTYNGAVQPVSLSPTESRFLVDWSRRQGATLFMTLLAAVSSLLKNRSGCADLPIGTVVANRNHIQIEPLIGFFVNTLVLRMDLGGDPSFSVLVDRARDVVLAAQSHQDLPFEKLVEELQPTRDPKRNPFVQILFALQQESVVAVPGLGGLQVEHLKFRSVDTTRFDLEFHLWLSSNGLEGIIVYNTDLFDRATAERLARHLQEILSVVTNDPNQRISEMPRMAAAERSQVLNVYSKGESIVPLLQSLHDGVERQVELTPRAIAVTCREQQLTYDELNQRANQLAHYLQAMGVRPDVRVGICLERSLNMVIALLGVLKAGGAYVPLDPAYPQERISYVLKDAQVAILLSGNQWKDVLSSRSSARVVALDSEWEKIVRYSQTNLDVPLDGRNLAYVIYTSGSTGLPKGVAIQHSNAVVFAQWARQIFSGDEFSGVLASTSICFDLSIFEIFVPLTTGGRVILVNNVLDVAELSEKEQVRLINTVPSAIAELIRVKALPSTVFTINLAGEALHNVLVHEIYQQGSVQRVLNLYGPSEDTTYSTYACLTSDREQGSAPIGKPIANTQAYVLDEGPQRQLVPIGATGELFLGGEGLAQGYLNRPDLTADRFVPNPFSNNPGSRLYRTGDRVRWLADGNLEFFGRVDHQVKIRGYRIELGEIEAALLDHNAVGNAVVIVRQDSRGVKQLVAYIEKRSDVESLDSSLLREFLRRRLPEYMAPSLYMVLDKLPLTPNGKVNRSALPPLAETRSDVKSYIPSRDTLELRCAQIWEQVLGVSPIGIKDNFFELGGHSLSAFVVISRIQKVFGQNLPISALFQRPTIEELAGLLRGDMGLDEFSPLVPLQKEGTRPPFFCVHPAGGNILCFGALASCLGSEQPFYGLQSRWLSEEELVERTLEEVATDYLQAIRHVQPAGPYFLGGYCIGGIFAFEMARQLQEAGEQVGALILIDSPAPDALSKEEFDDAQALSWFARDLGMPAGKRPSVPAEELRGLPAEQAFQKVLIKAKQEMVLPADAEASQLRRYFNCYVANSVAAVAYEPNHYSGPVTMLRARDEQDKHNLGPTLGWKPFMNEMNIRDLPGDHATIIFHPNVEILAETLLQVLSLAQQVPAADKVGVPWSNKSLASLGRENVLRSSVSSEDIIHVQHVYTVRRPIDAVFAFLADPETEPMWNPWIRGVRRDPKALLEDGMSFVAVYRFMGREFEMQLQICRYLPSSEVSFQVLDGPFTARTSYSLQANGDGETRVHMDLAMDPKDFFGFLPKSLLRPIFQKSMKDDCRRQKDLLENQF